MAWCRDTETLDFLPMHKKLLAIIVSLFVVSVFSGCASRLQRGARVGDKPPLMSQWGNALSFNMSPAQGNVFAQPAIWAGDIAKVPNATPFTLAIRGNTSDKVVYLRPGESTEIDLSLTNYSIMVYAQIDGEQQFVLSRSFARSGDTVNRYHYTFTVKYYDGPSYENRLNRFYGEMSW